MTAGECLKITDYTTHKIPEPILQDWTSLSHLSFSHYRYSPRTKEFTASFDLLAPSHHPVYAHALDHKGEKAREALLLSAHSMASTFVRSGITDASLLGRWDPDPNDEMMQSHALMQEARSRTRVILTWHFQSTAAAATSDTLTFRELREEGVTVRHYKAVGALSDQERNPEEAVAISHKDFATNQDFFRWITEPDVRLPPPENKAR